MRFAGFLAAGAALAGLWALSIDAVAPEQLLAGALIVLVHMPVLLTVKQSEAILGKVSGPEMMREASLALLVLLAWGFVAMVTDQLLPAGLLGLAYAVLVSIGFALVRATREYGKWQSRRLTHSESSAGMTIINVGCRWIYVFRAIAGAMSAVALWQVSQGVPPATFLIFAALAAQVCGAVTGAVAARLASETLKREGRQLPLRVAAQLAAEPVDATIYVSKSSTRIKKTVEDISIRAWQDGVSIALLARDPSVLKSLPSRLFAHRFLAPTIQTLDTYAAGDLGTIIYLDDAEKNGHMVRFGQFQHVLIAERDFVPMSSIPQNFNMYDVIATRTDAIAVGIQKRAAPEIAAKVVSLEIHQEADAPKLPGLSLQAVLTSLAEGSPQ